MLPTVKKAAWVRAPPKLPPAPIKPQMRPKDLLDMKGTMPYTDPHAACIHAYD